MLGNAVAFLTTRAPQIAANIASEPTPVSTVHGLRDHDPHYGMSPSVYALIFGIVSGLSLPIGAGLGIIASPVKPHLCALMMAFGAGALLFAVTVELYGHALHEVDKNRMSVLEMFTIIFGALCGAAFYLTTNQWLKDTFPESDETPETARSVEHAQSSPNAGEDSEKAPLLKATLKLAKKEREELSKERHEREEMAPMMTALKMEAEDSSRDGKAKAKSAWAKLRGEKRQAIRLLSKDAWSFKRPREQAIKALHDKESVDKQGLVVALGIFLGLLVDGLPEGILMGFLSAEGHLTPVLLFSLFVANLPEAFASGSLMVQAGLSTGQIMGLWTGLMLLVGGLCGLSCYLLLFFFPTYGAHAAGHGGGDLPMSVLIGISLVEGITGGAMIACISSVMLPEAFANCDKNRPFLHQTGFLCTAGFLVSVGLKTLFG
jgi:uncharacterized membrane protein